MNPNIGTRPEQLVEDLARRSELEQLVARVSRSFVGIAPGELGTVIDRTLEQIGAFVAADRSYLFQFDAPSATMANTHEWCADGIEPQQHILQDLPLAIFPYTLAVLATEPYIDTPLVDELPDAAAAEKAILKEQGIQSVLLVRLCQRSGELVGFLGFDAVRAVRPWRTEDIQLLTVISDLVAAALEHDALLLRLSESEGRQRATLEALPDVLVVLDVQGRILEFSAPEGMALPAAARRPVGVNIWRVMDREDRASARAAVSLLDEGHLFGEFGFALGEGRSRYHYEGRLTRHGEDRFLAVVRDVTSRHHAETALRELALELTSAEEVQRRDLALQLHDGIGQELTAVNLRLQALQRRTGQDEPELAQAIGILQDTMRKTQDLTFDLSPTVLYELGLGPALAGLARRYSSAEGPAIEVDISGGSPALPTDAAVLLFRIARELLANAVKHAQAGRIALRLAMLRGAVQMTVADDGRGMSDDPRHLTQAGHSGGFGLFSIRQRIEPLGGRMEIATGRGTMVTITLPLDEQSLNRSRSETA
jgi:signal transduction histidine kinase